MKNIEDWTSRKVEDRSPAQELGRFVLGHSNSPEYLVSNLRSLLRAAEADLGEEKEQLRIHLKLARSTRES